MPQLEKHCAAKHFLPTFGAIVQLRKLKAERRFRTASPGAQSDFVGRRV
jgi:hypothetical protein